MYEISPPPLYTGPITQPPWSVWMAKAYTVLFGVTRSGTTAQRPTKALWIGRPYFDTTLGKPIWIKTVGPDVWVDATGATV